MLHLFSKVNYVMLNTVEITRDPGARDLQAGIDRASRGERYGADLLSGFL
jgi:hypothetical protein